MAVTAEASERETLTIQEAASRYGISRGVAYELARRGELPGVLRLGSRYVVVRAVVDRVLSGESVEHP